MTDNLIFEMLIEKFVSYKTISFDFDGTLTQLKYQKLAQKLSLDNKIMILTQRNRIDGQYVYALAEKLGIKKSDVIFTGGRDKWTYIDKYLIDIHYDDNKDQVDLINENSKNGKAILVRR